MLLVTAELSEPVSKLATLLTGAPLPEGTDLTRPGAAAALLAGDYAVTLARLSPQMPPEAAAAALAVAAPAARTTAA